METRAFASVPSAVCRGDGGGGGGMESFCLMGTFSIWGDFRVLDMEVGDGCTIL